MQWVLFFFQTQKRKSIWNIFSVQTISRESLAALLLNTWDFINWILTFVFKWDPRLCFGLPNQQVCSNFYSSILTLSYNNASNILFNRRLLTPISILEWQAEIRYQIEIQQSRKRISCCSTKTVCFIVWGQGENARFIKYGRKSLIIFMRLTHIFTFPLLKCKLANRW